MAAIVFPTTSAFFAQQPEQIDVRSLNISFHNAATEAYFTLKVLNSAGQEITYGGTSTYSLPSLFNCLPCNIPGMFSSNGFISGLQFRWASEKYIYFFVTHSDSSPIIISPRYTWKPRNFTVNGVTTVHGRIEVRDQLNNIVAFANDVGLHGDFSSRFWLSNNFPSRRLIGFSQIDYQLFKPFN